MKRNGTTAVILPVLLLLAAGCSKDSTGPEKPNPETAGPESSRLSQAPSGTRGYGFYFVAHDAASAIVDGTRYRKCTDSDGGFAVYTLTLTGKMLDEVWRYLDHGGTATIEVTTQHTFTGDADLNYSENITIEGGAVHGSHSNSAQASNPGWRSQVNQMKFEQAITRNDVPGMVGGDVITISANAHAAADLGSLCGEIKGGQVSWRMRGAVLWLNP